MKNRFRRPDPNRRSDSNKKKPCPGRRYLCCGLLPVYCWPPAHFWAYLICRSRKRPGCLQYAPAYSSSNHLLLVCWPRQRAPETKRRLRTRERTKSDAKKRLPAGSNLNCHFASWKILLITLAPPGRLLWYISPIIYCKDIMQISMTIMCVYCIPNFIIQESCFSIVPIINYHLSEKD